MGTTLATVQLVTLGTVLLDGTLLPVTQTLALETHAMRTPVTHMLVFLAQPTAVAGITPQLAVGTTLLLVTAKLITRAVVALLTTTQQTAPVTTALTARVILALTTVQLATVLVGPVLLGLALLPHLQLVTVLSVPLHTATNILVLGGLVTELHPIAILLMLTLTLATVRLVIQQ